jgi:hypothetical protein
MPSVSCLDKNRKILEDSIGGDRKIISYSGSTLNTPSSHRNGGSHHEFN